MRLGGSAAICTGKYSLSKPPVSPASELRITLAVVATFLVLLVLVLVLAKID